jgi:hypothetical protein
MERDRENETDRVYVCVCLCVCVDRVYVCVVWVHECMCSVYVCAHHALKHQTCAHMHMTQDHFAHMHLTHTHTHSLSLTHMHTHISFTHTCINTSLSHTRIHTHNTHTHRSMGGYYHRDTKPDKVHWGYKWKARKEQVGRMAFALAGRDADGMWCRMLMECVLSETYADGMCSLRDADIMWCRTRMSSLSYRECPLSLTLENMFSWLCRLSSW